MAHRRKGNINSFTYLACLVVMAARARDANRLLRVLIPTPRLRPLPRSTQAALSLRRQPTCVCVWCAREALSKCATMLSRRAAARAALRAPALQLGSRGRADHVIMSTLASAGSKPVVSAARLSAALLPHLAGVARTSCAAGTGRIRQVRARALLSPLSPRPLTHKHIRLTLITARARARFFVSADPAASSPRQPHFWGCAHVQQGCQGQDCVCED